MILLLLLQMLAPETNFSRYLRDAQTKLGLVPPITQVVPTDQGRPLDGDASWIPYGIGVRPTAVYVHPRFLRDAHPYIHEVVAFHESCHLYLGINRHYPSPAELQLQHLMIDGCVEWLFGPRYHTVMQSIPCGSWYPYEALRYNRRIGRERCRERRLLP